MCGIFGAVGSRVNKRDIRKLAAFAQQRGQDSSGFFDFVRQSFDFVSG